MKNRKRKFLMDDSISFKPNITTIAERYFHDGLIGLKGNEFTMCIECNHPQIPEKVSITLIYIDVSEIVNKKSISPLDIKEYYIKETLNLVSSQVKSLKEGILKISKKIDNKSLWKIKFEINAKHKNHVCIHIMDKDYKTI